MVSDTVHVFFLSILYGIWATRFVGTCTSLAASMAPVASTTSMSWTWKRGAARGWGPGNPKIHRSNGKPRVRLGVMLGKSSRIIDENHHILGDLLKFKGTCSGATWLIFRFVTPLVISSLCIPIFIDSIRIFVSSTNIFRVRPCEISLFPRWTLMGFTLF